MCSLFSKYVRSVLVSVRTSVNTVKAAYFLKARFSSKLVFDLNGAMDTLQSELPKCMPDLLHDHYDTFAIITEGYLLIIIGKQTKVLN